MFTPDLKKQFSEIFVELSKALDLTPAQYKAAITSYQFVGDWLSRPDSPLFLYKPQILPQGSFLLGTINRPIYREDFDVDLLCRLLGKELTWTQYDLKQIVGDRLKAHATLKKMLDKEGRRCWTLYASESEKFHMDVLPSIVAANFPLILESPISVYDIKNALELAIRITDRLTLNYYTSTETNDWLKSHPFGYAAWFKLRAAIGIKKSLVLNEVIQPIPTYEADKLPLQRIVQILKRHRDIIFNGDEDKPISIIITTLAALAYQGETDVVDALIRIVNTLESFIEERYDPKLNRVIKWIANPVNLEENFADKWPTHPQKEKNFHKWLRQVQLDIENVFRQRGMHNIQEAMTNPFGKNAVNSVFELLGERARLLREAGEMKMSSGTGMLGSFGRTGVPYHNNFGSGE